MEKKLIKLAYLLVKPMVPKYTHVACHITIHCASQIQFIYRSQVISKYSQTFQTIFY